MKSGNGMAGTGTSPWRCWPTPAWRWSGARRWNKEVREKRGLSQLGRKADTPDGARGPAVALPADMETSTYGRISAAVVPVETAAPGNGPALPLPTPPETPHHISATVVLTVPCQRQSVNFGRPGGPQGPKAHSDSVLPVVATSSISSAVRPLVSVSQTKLPATLLRPSSRDCASTCGRVFLMRTSRSSRTGRFKTFPISRASNADWLYPKLKPRWDLHLWGDRDWLRRHSEALPPVLGGGFGAVA